MIADRKAKSQKTLERIRRRFASAVEQLETRALLSTLFVNGSNHTGVEDGTQAHPFSHIQAAINKSAANDTVNVAAGVYAETLTINHALSLVGPNAGINPNTGTRGAEAVVIPAANNPSSGRMILVTGNNVTVDGLTIDGHNAALAGGQLLNGVSSNAASGVTNVDSSGKVAVISGLHVQDDVIRNLTAFGVMADINDFSTSTLAVSTGNTISNNLIDNLPVVSPVPGRGISIEDNFYADVTGNVITRAGTGIQAIFMLNPNPGATESSISGNTISDYALGIYLWTMDSDAPAFVVSNNTIVTENDPQTTAGNAGIELDRVLNTSAVTLSNNNVSGAHAGVEFQYTPVAPTVTLAGGTLAGNDYGVLVTNSDRPSADNPAKAVAANLSGVTIAGSKLAALDVVDALGTTTSTVTLNVDAATTLSGNAHGAAVSGTHAKLADPVKPVVTLTSNPPAQTASTSATFGFNATDNITTANDLRVQYKLDAGALTNATSPLTLNGLAIGAHTLTLTATDQAGNATTVTYPWTVTNGPPPPAAPSTPALAAASDTGSSATDGVTKVHTPTFQGTAPAGNTVTLFAGTTPLGTTTASPSGQWSLAVGGAGSLVASLADGSYAVTATDSDGTATSAASGSLALVIDNTPPGIALTSSPPAQTTSGVASFAFAASDNTTAAARLANVYSLDGGAPATASSPVNLGGLAAGPHTFALTTTDLAGNVGTTSYSWTVVAGASTLYVDGANHTGVEDGTQAHPFSHIQAAINASAAGDTVTVAAGVYAETLTINHALSLVGPNAGINPNTGTRGAEAVVIPAANNPSSGRMILVTGNNVTVDGLTIDGHNAALAGGQLLNGVSSNAASGVTNVDSSGKVAVISGLHVQDDVIRNLTAFGVMADINDFSTSTLAVSTGNTISNNLIDNLPVVSPVPGRGISIEDNFYADVTGNVITRAGTGIQAIFMVSPNPGPTVSSISGNTISDYALGIYLWTMDSDAPAFVVNDNTIVTENDPQTTAGNAGIELDRVLHTSTVSLSNNNVSGAHAGVEFQYTAVAPTVTVTGGTLAGNDYGVLVTNSDVPAGDVPPKAIQGSLSGVTIANSRLAAFDVVDALAAAGTTVTLNVDGTTVLSGNPHGAILSGTDAKLAESVVPVVTLTSTPPAQSAGSSASFGFNATDNVSTPNDLRLQYSLDGGTATSVTGPLSFSGLGLGAHTFALTATDQAGNSATASYGWTVTAGTLPPAAPSTPALAAASDTGSSATDGITKDSTPTYTGTAPAGATVSLFAGTTLLGSTTAASNGTWTFTVGGTGAVVTSLADGTFAITATAQTGAGTSAPSGSRSIVIDTTPPVIQATRSPLPNGAGWNNANVQAGYTASDASSGLTSPATGSFTFTSQGAGQSHTFTVNDVAGNSAGATVGSVNIDKTTPSVSIAASPNTLSSSSGGQATVTIAGKVTDSLSGPGSSLTYTVKDSAGQVSTSGTATLGAGGSYAFPLSLPTSLIGRSTTRTYTITVTGKDAAGNTKAVQTTVTVRTGTLVLQIQSVGKKTTVSVPKVTHPVAKPAHPVAKPAHPVAKPARAVPRPPARPKGWK